MSLNNRTDPTDRNITNVVTNSIEMPVKLEDVKRTAIAVKLADMRAMQNLLIDNNEALITVCTDRDISNRLEVLLRDDRKNLGIINAVIIHYGIKAEPRLTVIKTIEHSREEMVSSQLSLFEKIASAACSRKSRTFHAKQLNKVVVSCRCL